MKRFINPYHFISLSDKPERSQGNPEPEKLTGSITYHLRTKSCLFIPNTSSNRAFSYQPDEQDDPKNEHQLYDFFSCRMLEKDKVYDEDFSSAPVIPGSEIRGMIRSIYETLTNSCLSVLDGERRIGKRTVERFRPAVLKWDENAVYLYDAGNADAVYRNREDFSVRMFRECEIPDGSKVFFRKKDGRERFVKPDVTEMIRASDDNIADGSYLTGYLLKGNNGPDISVNEKSKSKCIQKGKKCIMLRDGRCPGKWNGGTEHCFLAEKHCAHVFFPAEGKRGIPLDETSLASLETVLEQYLKENPDSYREYAASYRAFMKKEADGLPVYYSRLEELGYLMLSPACITREVYRNTIGSLTDSYKKCSMKDREYVCPACRLFGNVGDKGARGSRIRFTDLKPVRQLSDWKEYYTEELLTIDPLAVPHLENTAFYLKKPDPDGDVWFWTYDYYTVRKPDGQVIVKPYQPEIAGRKFYWNNLSGIRTCDKQTALNKTVRAVRPESEFSGEIYFDGISETQLKQLIYILTYTSDGNHGFKLGSGKPLGFGSVELSIVNPEDISVRLLDNHGYHFRHYTEQELEEVQDIVCTDQKSALEKADSAEPEQRKNHPLGLDRGILSSFERITHYPDEETMKQIHYPGTGEKEEEGFQWFMRNTAYYSYDRKTKEVRPDQPAGSPETRIQTKINYGLPPLDSSDLPWLPVIPDAPADSARSRDVTKTRAENTSQSRTKQRQGSGTEGKARILSESRPAGNNNANFLEYDIEILDIPEFAGKKCIVTAHKKVLLSQGMEISVRQYKGRIFNLKGKTGSYLK